MYNNSVLIKPASSLCNLSCNYCFYHDIADNREIKSHGIMSYDTLETIIKKSIEDTSNQCYFMFQGGEPTLAGLDFFKKAIELQKKHNKKNIKIINSIQTNGYIIDSEWVKFFKDNKILVGLSIDGPKELHDANRLNLGNKGSFNKVIKTLEMFNRNKIEYNVLSVINSRNAKSPTKLFNFFKKYNVEHVQLIPCLDPLDGSSRPESLSSEMYIHFLKGFFDQWYWDFLKGNVMNVRYFNNLLGILLGQGPESCDMAGQCTCQLVIESNGDTYPCDFYCTDEYKIGNILESSLDETRNDYKVKEFVDMSLIMSKDCRKCVSYALCRGGCRRHYVKDEYGVYKNMYCDVYKEFLDYAEENLKNAAYLLLKRSTTNIPYSNNRRF